jgi:hypothetical protein
MKYEWTLYDLDDEGLVSQLEEIDDDLLTDWEREFIGSLRDWVDWGRKLTDRQQEKAVEVIERHSV